MAGKTPHLRAGKEARFKVSVEITDLWAQEAVKLVNIFSSSGIGNYVLESSRLGPGDLTPQLPSCSLILTSNV